MASTNTHKIPIGTILGEKYRVTREIGRGGMAAVYEAENIDIGKRVAVKVLAQELITSPVVVERFLREARAAASVTSPFICDVYDSGRLDDGRPFLVLELLEGESLYERMTHVRQIDTETTLRVITHVARGLVKAHAANIVHRDLKPENIFLTRDSEGALIAKILDFGLAKFYAPIKGDAAQARLTREGAVFGTPAYMSPEQVRGQGHVDHRADLWALGCIAYESLTGRTVWSTDQGVAMTFAQIASAPLPNALLFRPDLPQTFQAWFEKALARGIEDRFQSARELAEALAGALASDSVHMPSMHSFLDITARAPAAAPPQPPGKTPQSPTEPTDHPSSAEGTAARHVDASPSQKRQPSVVSPLSSTVDRKGPGQKARGHGGRTLFTWLGVAAIVTGGYLGWLVLLRPAPTPITTMSIPSAPTAAAASASAAPEPPAPAAAKGPRWVALVGSAQAQIAGSNLNDAIKTLHDASELAGGGPARVMFEQAQVSAATKGGCKLTGLSHPRPFSLSNAAGRPTVAFTPKGALVAWTDNHESAGNDHAYAILLDASMRPVGEPRDITPEASLVTSPHLFTVGDRFVVLYSDGKGAAAGIHVRWLDAEGRIDGPARTVTTRRPSNSAPSIDRAPDGTFWVAWEDDRKVESSDLYLRHLSAELDPLGGEIRASDYVPRGKPHVRSPSLGIAGGYLTVAYRFEREPMRVVSALRIGLGDADLLRGVEPSTDKGPPKDRQIGEATILNVDKERADAPRIDCTTEGCFVVWNAEDGSACAAYLESTHGQILWRKRFDRKGSHPTVSIAPSGGAAVAWFGKGRLNLAPIARDGVGQPTPLTRALGDPPPAALTPGGAPGEWYVSWLETESGHPEVYAARALCK